MRSTECHSSYLFIYCLLLLLTWTGYSDSLHPSVRPSVFISFRTISVCLFVSAKCMIDWRRTRHN